MEKYGFVYLWYDKKHKRFYIGSHWGTADDGYVCSSNWMKQAFRRRPEDFKRRILKHISSSRKDLFIEEQRWLDFVKDDEIKERYYNLSKNVINHWSMFDPEKTKKTLSEKAKDLHNDPIYREKYLLGLKDRKVQDPKSKSEKQRQSMVKTMEKKYPKENRIKRSSWQSEEHRKKNSDGGKNHWASLSREQRLNRLSSLKSGKGTKRPNRFWWNDGEKNTRNEMCPGEKWTRGKCKK